MKTSERGFYQGEQIAVTRGGHVRVAESSAAVCEGDEVQSGYVWLFLHDAAHHESRQPIDAAAHMSHEQARELARALNALVDAIEARP